MVSIPGGFSGSLRRQRRCTRTGSTTCFNPWRVFRLVATDGVGHIFIFSSAMFQSLAGFQARCDGGSKMVLLP